MIPDQYQIWLYWTPGHEGVDLNEQAGKEAKAAAEEDLEPVILPISLGGLMQHMKEVCKYRGVKSIQPCQTKGRCIADALNPLEKGQAAAIFELRCGHCPLKKFLHRIGAEDDDKCDTFKAVKTEAHFLVYCKKYTKERQAFQRRLKEEGIKLNTNLAWTLLDTPKVYPCLAQFILETGRF